MLEEYKKKRDFKRTSEPPPEKKKGEGPLIFVVQKHAARRLHYDFRLEVDGVLKSWSVPKGPSLDPEMKRLAVMVEDHPLEYGSFEGVIPPGEYGAGQVIVWDQGTYSPDEEGRFSFRDRAEAEARMRDELARGKLSIYLRGHKLRGSWTLVKIRTKEKDWLLIKHRDEFAVAEAEKDILEEEASSVISDLTIEDLKSGVFRSGQDKAAKKPGELPGTKKAPFPLTLAPMLATPTTNPFSNPDWLFEPKLDGYRTLALIQESRVKLISRRGLDVTESYPQIARDLTKQPAGELILDGEIVALNPEGRPSFQSLQEYLSLVRDPKIAHLEEKIPVIYYVFDLLYLDNYDLRGVPLHQRKNFLKLTLRPSSHLRLVEAFEKEGVAVYKAAISQGFEGTVAKHKNSLYESGKRSRSWLKIKATKSDEFIIGGFSLGAGWRAGTFGDLVLGYFDEKNRLVYAGRVGTGFDDSTLEDLRRRFESIKTDECPFLEIPPPGPPVVWVRPELVAEIKFSEWTRDGYLRQPVFMRLREDKAPGEVHRVKVMTPPVSKLPERRTSDTLGSAVTEVLAQLKSEKDELILKVDDFRIPLNNLEKVLWPVYSNQRALTKRDFLTYLTKVAPYILSHLRDRPISLSRYPDGIYGERFYQKHWRDPLPEFVETVNLFSKHKESHQEYLLCNNLATLLWLGQLADIELP